MFEQLTSSDTGLSSIAANGVAVAERLTDTAATHAIDLATDVALPAAKFAGVRFVRSRAKTLVLLLVVAAAVPMIVKRVRHRDDESAKDVRS